ncbi:MAG TPA: hypothetical protein VK871_05350 [Candidatus Limnocylindrales bacterium]|nr:hypothetical protein [Candidatus Limnocylindrales bacterium]
MRRREPVARDAAPNGGERSLEIDADHCHEHADQVLRSPAERGS